jgi:sugar O-acyltransferase (sialic acid O-acetyltransferase NeuD family)
MDQNFTAVPAPTGPGNSSDKRRGLVIVGDTAFAEIACEYFTHDSAYEVVGFAVERAFKRCDELAGRPVVAFEDVEQHFSPRDHSVYVAATYTQLNRLRTRLAQTAKQKGYALASYVSSRAFVWRNVEIGEHAFVFESNVIQPFVKIGSNVVLWSGNHIGHHSTIGNNVFVASHVVISGFVSVGENTFVGVNATFANNISVGKDCLIGAGVTILKNVEDDRLFGANMSAAKELSPRRYFKVPDGM